MKRIKKFCDFDGLDFISESRVYFLNDLSFKLTELKFDGNEWADKLLKAQGKNIDSDTTFLDLDGENFSFSRETDLKRVLFDNDYENLFIKDISKSEPQRVQHYLGSRSQTDISGLPSRGSVKMGKVIRKILPEIPDKDLESIVNILKSETSDYEIKLVSGQEIAKYYKKESCDKKLLSFGTLINSCMLDMAEKKPNIFDIYTKNPEVCQLAIMINGSGQLVARALVWKIDEVGMWLKTSDNEKKDFYSNLDVNWQLTDTESNGQQLFKSKSKNLYFMDRVYYTKDWMVNYFQKWAEQRKMITNQGTYYSYMGKTDRPVLSVKVNKLAYRQFPYMDTFKHYDVQSATLCNSLINERGFNLSSTIGDYEPHGTGFEKTLDKATNYIRRVKDIF